MSLSSRPSYRAFTIVEMLVVVAVISLLLALLFPALGAVRRNASKRTEANHLKQIQIAWTLYGTHNGDAALPGYIEPEVHSRWRTRYEYMDRVPIPPAPSYGAADPNIAGPWTWRLAKYVDFAHEVLRGYELDEAEGVMIDIDANPTKALQIANEPSFGYNGYYVGGYLRAYDLDSNGSLESVRPDFFDHCETNNPINPTSGLRLMIPTSIAQISRSDQMIIFSSSTRAGAAGLQRFLDDTPGAALVVPPILANVPQWQPPGDTQGGNRRVETLVNDAFVPLARYTGGAAILYADGHIDQQAYDALYDQRKWIDNATWELFQHAQCPP